MTRVVEDKKIIFIVVIVNEISEYTPQANLGLFLGHLFQFEKGHVEIVLLAEDGGQIIDLQK
jgi:hypothetical protein